MKAYKTDDLIGELWALGYTHLDWREYPTGTDSDKTSVLTMYKNGGQSRIEIKDAPNFRSALIFARGTANEPT